MDIMGLVTQEEAACLLSKRPDILPFYKANGWDIDPSNWIAILTNWWGMTDEKDKWGGDLQKYLAALGCVGGGGGNGGLPPIIPGIDTRIVLLAGAALIIGMMFFGD